MIAPQLRRQINELWTLFWSSGMTNPLTSIEQITFLLFIKRLQALDNERLKKGRASIYGRQRYCKLPHHPDDGIDVDQSLPEGADPTEYKDCIGHGTCRWSYIQRGERSTNPKTGEEITPHDHLSQYVFPWLRTIGGKLQRADNTENGLSATGEQLQDAYFLLPREKTATLTRAIGMIDGLFRSVSTRAANSDMMGDIFEYLLSEIKTSGKNGQFRTPRHIIRFMTDLADPEPGARIIDPAAGTGGYLISSIQHWLKAATDPETVVLEWDGEPHRLYGGDPEVEKHLVGSDCFTGFDIDRTMVRIGWMNLLLHGVEAPNFMVRDTLGKSMPDEAGGRYNVALANPPFKGEVDTGDLHPSRFPKRGDKPLTNRSQLLFLWLILDLLEVGGRSCVIVPDGVLFGSGTAEKELRRQLVMDHELQAVISLPGGVFEPYSGVKTSILLFRKRNERPTDEAPRTQKVWFYRVENDGYTLDKKRDPHPEQNDLWDALEKFRRGIGESLDYYEARYRRARWCVVDDKLIQLFPELAHEKGNALGIDERFRGWTGDPSTATARVTEEQEPHIRELYTRVAVSRTAKEQRSEVTALTTLFNRTLNDLLEDAAGSEEHAAKALKSLLKAARDAVLSSSEGDNLPQPEPIGKTELRAQVRAIVREFARLDGYDLLLRERELELRQNSLSKTKSWFVPVRTWARRDDWQSEDGAVQGSHDEKGSLRPEFLADTRIYVPNLYGQGAVKAEYLDPDCIEANDFNLSVGQYEPFTPDTRRHEKPAEIIADVLQLERQLQVELETLLEMVAGVR